MSKLIRLDLIPASILERQVTPGGLVEERDVFLAYKEQAESFPRRKWSCYTLGSVVGRAPKSTVFQFESEKETVEILASERLSSGIYEWTIIVENLTENMFLGGGGR
jgi:hypothetical protein